MTKQPKSWRDMMAVHPAADLFPLMTPDELKVLGKDIKKNGLKEPIALTYVKPSGGPCQYSLLDGRNRLDAMELVGLSPNLQLHRGVWKMTLAGIDKYSVVQPIIAFDDPFTYVLSKNMRRRHLTAEQKREIIAKMLKARPSKSNRTIAKEARVDDKTVGSVRRELEGRAEIPHVSTVEDTAGRKQPTRKPPSNKPRDVEDYIAEKNASLVAAKDADVPELAPQQTDVENYDAQPDGISPPVQRILEAIKKLDDQQFAELQAALMQQWTGGLYLPVKIQSSPI